MRSVNSSHEEMNRKRHKLPLWLLILVAVFVTLALIKLLWKIPIYNDINGIILPEDSETFLEAKARWSDAGLEHIIGEKVFTVDMPYEELLSYVEANNSAAALKHITIREFFFMEVSNRVHWPSDYDDVIDEQDRHKYFVVRYYRSLS